jgi:hypothetical protein
MSSDSRNPKDFVPNKHEYKASYAEKFACLESAIDPQRIPAGLESVADSLRKKLAAEKTRYLASFENEHGRQQMPSMGIIETFAEKTEEPEWFFGSDIRARNRIRVILSQASVDPQTQEIVKESVISESVMTEKQFADIISSPNRGSGMPVTQTVRLGQKLEPFDPNKDQSKHNASAILSRIGLDEGLSKSIHETRKAIEEALEAGRIPKSTSKSLARNLGAMVRNLPRNSAFKVDQITEMYAKKVSEATLVIHLDARSQHKQLKLKGDK